MKLQGLSIVGQRRGQPGGKTLQAKAASTSQSLGPDYSVATAQDVDEAAKLATRAFEDFGSWPATRRAELLRRIVSLLETNAATVVDRANQETALPRPRLEGEMVRTCGQLRMFATLIEDGWWLDARIDHADPARKPVPKPDLRSMRVPLGPVAVFSSSNFPLAFSVAGGDTASALAAGCPVIVKAHQGHLGTSELVGMLVQQAVGDCSAPEGIFSLLFGPGREVGMGLVKHPLVKAVGFTGSRSGGRALMDAAAARPAPIPVYAEMGSINPVFILRGAIEQNGPALATGLHGSVTLGVGQFCTNPGLVFAERSPATQPWLEKLQTLMASTAPGRMLTADICSEYCSGVARFSKVPRVRRLTEVQATDPTQAEGHAVLFATDAKTFLETPALMDEVFGPSTLIVECSSREEMLAAAAKLEGQLTATVHGTPEDLVSNAGLLAILKSKAGRLVCNGFPTGVEVGHAMNHGGPYPATADGRSTSVGTRAIERFVRPVCYQNWPDALLPEGLQEANPLGIQRLVDGKWGRH